ncbi:MAG: CBS domain-containing protein [Promethearchaeota archaeon]
MGDDRLKELGDVKVFDIMVHDPLFITPDEKISTTELLMLRKNVNGLPVVDDNKNKRLIGIITQRDIRLARFAMVLESPHTLVKDLMTYSPFVVSKDDSLKKALSIMFEKNIERLPVVNNNKELIGLVLQQDILKKLLECLNE